MSTPSNNHNSTTKYTKYTKAFFVYFVYFVLLKPFVLFLSALAKGKSFVRPREAGPSS